MRNTNEKALFAVLFRYSNRLNASYVSIIQRETYYLALSHFKMHIFKMVLYKRHPCESKNNLQQPTDSLICRVLRRTKSF